MIHVPFIIVYPTVIPQGISVAGLTESVDLLPTVIDIAGIELPKSVLMDGVSLLNFIHNPELGKEAVLSANFIRTADYKYIYILKSDTDLLYDLRKDAGETMNIAEKRPLIKEDLKNRYGQFIQMYSERLIKSMCEDSPGYPFYYSIRHFKIEPEEVFEECEDFRNTRVILEEVSPIKSWLFNRYGLLSGLFCRPKSGVIPTITLSTRVPNGQYHISVMLESLSDISFPPEKLGFRFRFDRQGKFLLPKCINKVAKSNEEFSFYYLDLDKTTIKKTDFSIQIAFDPPDDTPYVIRHIKFVPDTSEITKATKAPDEEEIQRRLDILKSLKYLQ